MEDNKEYRKEYKKAYREANKEKIAEYRAKYWLNVEVQNKDEINRKQRENYEKRKPTNQSLLNLISNISSYYRICTMDISNTQQNLFAVTERAYNTYQKPFFLN